MDLNSNRRWRLTFWSIVQLFAITMNMSIKSFFFFLNKCVLIFRRKNIQVPCSSVCVCVFILYTDNFMIFQARYGFGIFQEYIYGCYNKEFSLHACIQFTLAILLHILHMIYLQQKVQFKNVFLNMLRFSLFFHFFFHTSHLNQACFI